LPDLENKVGSFLRDKFRHLQTFLISENAAPVNRPFPTFFAPAGRSWALVPRRDGQGSRREPKALPLAVVGAGDMVSQRQQAPVPIPIPDSSSRPRCLCLLTPYRQLVYGSDACSSINSGRYRTFQLPRPCGLGSRSRRTHIYALKSCMRVSRRRVAIKLRVSRTHECIALTPSWTRGTGTLGS
jgi:hypothetical protein